jgi:hypothetical protein
LLRLCTRARDEVPRICISTKITQKVVARRAYDALKDVQDSITIQVTLREADILLFSKSRYLGRGGSVAGGTVTQLTISSLAPAHNIIIVQYCTRVISSR